MGQNILLLVSNGGLMGIKNSILCAVDFSPTSLNALRFAADMAATHQKGLLLVHILPIPKVGPEMSARELANKMVGLKNEADQKLQQLKDQLIISNGIQVFYDSEFGEVGEEINQLADHYKVEMICVGCGRSENNGSCESPTITNLAKDALQPILLVPITAKYNISDPWVQLYNQMDTPSVQIPQWLAQGEEILLTSGQRSFGADKTALKNSSGCRIKWSEADVREYLTKRERPNNLGFYISHHERKILKSLFNSNINGMNEPLINHPILIVPDNV